MVNSQLANWVRNQIAQGYTTKQIYDSLVRQGYNSQDINEAINFSSSSIKPLNQQPKQNIGLYLIVCTVIILVISGSIFYYFFFNKNLEGNNCVYSDDRYLTCGKSWTIVSEGKEYNLTKNKPLHFPQGENKLIGFTNLKDLNETYLLYLEIGTHELSEETSRRAVGSGIVKGFTGEPSPDSIEECEKKTDDYDKSDCYIELASKNKDATICAKITHDESEKDKCYYGVAMKVKDKSICKNIASTDSQQLCIDLVTQVNKN